jgi:thioester reductase-like protein
MTRLDSADLNALSADEKRALLKKMLGEKVARARPDLAAEAEMPLPEAPRGADLERAARPERILLTGTTGFVGAFVLRELLQRTHARIYCLARAKDDDAAVRRIEDNLRSYGVWSEEQRERIVPLAGDLDADWLGLSPKMFECLAETVDVVYHVAAVVNLTSKYALLKGSNAEGTRRILELACRQHTKPLHYLSTYAIFDSIHNMGRTFAEDGEPAHWKGLSNGYAESKWVAESLVRRARAAGLPATIYRVGWVIGHSETGAWNKSDFIPRLIKCCTEVGMACSLGSMTMTPVDFLSEALVVLSLQPEHLGSTFHLSNGERYSSDQIFDWTRAFGYSIRKVPYEDWDAAMKSLGQELAVAPMLLFLEQAAELSIRPSDWFSNEPRFDATRTLAILARQGIQCPTPGSELMSVYLSSFVKSGYLRPPR